MMKHVLMAGAALALVIGGRATAGVKEGIAAWQSGDYATAIAQWQPAANAGDADAQFNLGQAYKLGHGVPQDLGTAQGWYYKAALQGHAQAEANYGLMVFQNGDRNGAMPWLQKAALQGEPRAQYVVGTALFNGDLAGKDWPRAYAYMTRAAAAGLPQAANSLAQMDQFMPIGDRQKGVAIARTLGTPTMAGTLLSSPTGTAGIATAALPPSSVSGDQIAAATSSASKPAKGRHGKAAPAAAPAAPAAPPVVFAEATPTANFGASPTPSPPESPPPPASPPAPEPVAGKPATPPPARPVHHAAPPSRAPAAAGHFRVQLGAFATPGGAEAAWKSSSRGLGGVRHYTVSAGALTRLQAGPFASRADAEKACKSAGGACMVVAAP